MAKRAGNHLQVLDFGEALLTHSPHDIATQLDMAHAADSLGWLDLAVWLLEQAWHHSHDTPLLNRALARLYEKKENYSRATVLWQLVRQVKPHDLEAHQKIHDLAAKETIVRGQYRESGKGIG